MLAALLLVCLAHGLWVARGLGSYAAILDTYRDAGFVQGFLDGNLVGDPSLDGAKRYYPPLLHALAALVALITHTQPLELLTRAAPWVNLLVPATFFLLVRRLIDAPTAAVATVLFVCFDGILLPPWMAASYSPWHSVPALTQALFFCGAWLVSARTRQGRFIDALWIGSAIGIVFLAHTVPALILAAITAAAAVATQGMRARTVAWVATAGGIAALWALPFLIPLIVAYHLKIVSAAGAFIDPLFDPSRIPTRVIAASLPGMVALALLGLSAWGRRLTSSTLSRQTLVVLTAWIGLPLLFVVRHFGCGGGGTSAVCTAFVVPVHHWMLYLQSALACVFGYAAMSMFSTLGQAGARASVSVAAAGAAFVLACILLLLRPMDQQMRERAIDMRNRVDLDMYQWLLANTRPDALFVTDISTDAVHDTAAMAVLAGGRKSVALPFTFSNPYVDWQVRERREEAYLAAASTQNDKAALCRLRAEAGDGNIAYVALAAATQTRIEGLQPVFRSRQNTVYAVTQAVCG